MKVAPFACQTEFEKILTTKCKATKTAMTARLDIHDLFKDGKDVRAEAKADSSISVNTSFDGPPDNELIPEIQDGAKISNCE